jgi:hypothetical protein
MIDKTPRNRTRNHHRLNAKGRGDALVAGNQLKRACVDTGGVRLIDEIAEVVVGYTVFVIKYSYLRIVTLNSHSRSTKHISYEIQTLPSVVNQVP